MTRRLVVVADDAGLDPVRDAAILRAHDLGLVTAASLVANGPTLEAFVAAARARPRLSLGLHVNLTEGRPLALTRGFTLTGPGGAFLGDKQALWRRAIEAQVDAVEVEREVVAQWRQLEALGVTPDHVNGHQHVHVLPALSDGVLAALAAVRARVAVRVPAEDDPPAGVPPVRLPAIPVGTAVFPPRRLAQLRAGHGGVAGLGVHADRFRRRVVAPLVATEGFLGLALGAAPRLDVLVESLRRVAGATVEWMTHPGAMPGRPGTYGGDAARDEELALLTHPAARAAVEAAGFALASFRDLLA